MSYLSEYEEIDGGYVAFGGDPKEGKITGKGKINIGKLDFEDVYFVKDLKFNLFSVSQMCDKKNSVLFTDTKCDVLSLDFKLLDESQVLLRVPRKNNMYSADLKNVAPSGGLTCLFTKATLDESNLWHRRLGHKNSKTMNKLVKGNLVRVLQCLSAKTTSWDKFSSTMASAIICLATNQKFNFSKYIFDNMVKNLEGRVKFLMFKGTKIPTDTQQTPTIIQPTISQPQGKQKTKKPRRKDTELPQTSVPTEVVTDEAVDEEMYDSVERAATTATGLDAEQDRGIISKTQFTTTLNKPSSIGTSSHSEPRRQETIGVVATQARSERVSKLSNDPPLSRVNTLGSGEDRLQLAELIELCTQLQSRVLALETTKTNQALELEAILFLWSSLYHNGEHTLFSTG
nr:ribonuclease H-like domain-containing protein [Tanacetum cinerariifolium]